MFMLMPNNILELKDYFDIAFHAQEYNFPFQVDTLEFTYENEEFIAKSTVSKIKDKTIPTGYLDVIVYKLSEEMRTFFNFSGLSELSKFSYIYNRESSEQLVQETVRVAKLKLDNLLYEYPSIKSCTYAYKLTFFPLLQNINGMEKLQTDIKPSCSEEEFNSMLIESNVKKHEFNELVDILANRDELHNDGKGLKLLRNGLLKNLQYNRDIHGKGLSNE